MSGSTSLRDVLLRIASGYHAAAAQPYRGHPLARFIRKDAAAALADALGDDGGGLLAVGSPGQGGWADSPWLAVLDALVTDSPLRGYYVAYLFPRSMDRVSLSLQLGTTHVRERTRGSGAARRELASLVSLIRRSLPSWRDSFPEETIHLEPDSPTSRAAFYEHGHAFGVTYQLDQLPGETTLRDDLRRMVDLYRRLTASVGDELEYRTAPRDELAGRAEDEGGWEHPTQYRLHRRVERNRKLAERAKRALGYVCQACGFDFELAYGDGLGRGFIEAHHLTPLSLLHAERVLLDPRRDFAVLCANCHRMMHRRGAPTTVEGLRLLLRRGA